jgi:serine/threonine protein kinase
MDLDSFLKRYTYNPSTDIIGNGGFGKVYKAYDDFRDRYVAIKVCEVKSENEQYTLANEVKINKSLEAHKNIAYYEDCFRFDQSNGTFDYGILQFYEEGNLASIIKKNILKPEQKVQIAEGIMQGLLFLRKSKILHRDLKCENILISKKGQEYIPKITDFGLSKVFAEGEHSYFENSFVGGSIKYSAPEQLLNGKVKENADIWSLGVILYELFSGKLPIDFTATVKDNPSLSIENIKKITEGELNIDYNIIPTPYDNLIKGCLIVNPKDRIQSVEVLNNMITAGSGEYEETMLVYKDRNKFSTHSNSEKEIQKYDDNQIQQEIIGTEDKYFNTKKVKLIALTLFLISSFLVLGYSFTNFSVTKIDADNGTAFLKFKNNSLLDNKKFSNITIPHFGSITAIADDTLYIIDKSGKVLEAKALTDKKELMAVDSTIVQSPKRVKSKSTPPSKNSDSPRTFTSDAKRQTIILGNGNDNSTPIIINPPQKSKNKKSTRSTTLVNGSVIITN